jgi:hypothetical protein
MHRAHAQGTCGEDRAHLAAAGGVEDRLAIWPRFRELASGLDQFSGALRRDCLPPQAQPRLMNVPLRSSVTACCSSACVFMTIGPYQATGSSIGLPETSRKRIPSSPDARSPRRRDRTARASGFPCARE